MLPFGAGLAIRSRDIPPISPRCAGDITLRLMAQHGVDPVGHPPRAPHVLAFDPCGRVARLFLARSRRPRRSPCRPAAAAAGRRIQPGHREPAHHGSSRRRCPSSRGSAAAESGPASGPRRAGRCSTRSPGAARWPAPTRTCPPAATAVSGQNTAAAGPAAHPPPQRQPGAYADGSGRLGSCTRHTGMITRRLRSHRPIRNKAASTTPGPLRPAHDAKCGCLTSQPTPEPPPKHQPDLRKLRVLQTAASCECALPQRARSSWRGVHGRVTWRACTKTARSWSGTRKPRCRRGSFRHQRGNRVCCSNRICCGLRSDMSTHCESWHHT